MHKLLEGFRLAGSPSQKDLRDGGSFSIPKRGMALVLLWIWIISLAGLAEKTGFKGDETVKTDRVIYLAGGCFWGVEELMQSIPGVREAVSGYANGTDEKNATYERVCRGDTGFRETVKVVYDPSRISLDGLLFIYYQVVDKSAVNQQGNDHGTQYQAGIYYTNDEDKSVVERVTAIEKARTADFKVEIGPLRSFYRAEEYHQDYLEKNPNGYCHIPREEIKLFSQLRIDPGSYPRPSDAEIKAKLGAEEYEVTQHNGTERPFTNPYWNLNQKGIYVDIVSGEPLFSSLNKFDSSCGWPAFSAPIEGPSLISLEDRSHGMLRTEVRSRAANSHLGHVFSGDGESPSGIRYCINSASLRFIPFEEMEAEGYGQLKALFD